MGKQGTIAVKKSCDQCEVLYINGLFCHETGCPNQKKVWQDGEWIAVYDCPECGSTLEVGQPCCEL